MSDLPKCRHCGTPMPRTFVDLGMSAVANSYVPLDKAGADEPKFRLHTRVCENCWLVQIDQDVPADQIFSGDYAYFSSFSTSWLEHAKTYATRMTHELDLGPDSLVVEIASNDGYLLQYFVKAGIPVLGIEPSGSVAKAAEEKGVATLVDFFGEDLAKGLAAKGKEPDLICSANVLAHVPDINDFVAGVAALLTGDAIYTVEFPHLLRLIEDVQFDTIYHEHYSYLSLVSVERIFADYGLRVFHVEALPTHGGSLRVFACLDGANHAERGSVSDMRAREKDAKLDCAQGYEGFDARVKEVRNGLLDFLHSAKAEGKSVVAYGAAAKGNTMLNYCGIGPDLIKYCVDRNPAKQDTLLPGSQIRVYDPEVMETDRPDYVLILPWNLRREISAQLSHLGDKGTLFVIPVPALEIFSQ